MSKIINLDNYRLIRVYPPHLNPSTGTYSPAQYWFMRESNGRRAECLEIHIPAAEYFKLHDQPAEKEVANDDQP